MQFKLKKNDKIYCAHEIFVGSFVGKFVFLLLFVLDCSCKFFNITTDFQSFFDYLIPLKPDTYY